MKDSHKGVAVYLLIAFGLAWILWEGAVRFFGLNLENPITQLALLPGAFAPAAACFAVRRWVTREGFSDAGLRPRLRKNLVFYLMAWLWPLIGVTAIAVCAWLTGLGEPDFSLKMVRGAFSGGKKMPNFIASNLILFILLQNLLTALPASLILWGEEFGWRSYLQRRLFAGQPLKAAVATGVIWSLWHLPINLRGYNFPGHPVAGMLVFTVSTVMLSIFFGWLVERSGSIWPACLAHSSTNAVGVSLARILFPDRGGELFFGYVGILGWLPLGALTAWIVLSGGLGSRQSA